MDKTQFLEKYAKQLNEAQLKAVQAVKGPVLLLAVPGSGKTTVLVTRLGYMLYCEGISPENILTLTYTVAATKDMANRFETLFGDEYGTRLEFRTINGICAKVISRYGMMIGKEPFELVTDEGRTGKILSEILAAHLQDYPTESDVRQARSLITYCKNMLLSDEEIIEKGESEGIPLFEIYKAYNSYLRENSLMDYDDQMVYAYRMLRSSPELLKYYRDIYKYICVDEAQDTSKIQHLIIKLLAGDEANLFMVGDEDQSIYGFRAAYPEALLDFEKDHPGAKVLVMDRNYRSGARIVSVADNFICHNKARHDKHMVATRQEGAEIRYIDLKSRSAQYSYLTKVAQQCDRETAVLYRDNESVLPLVDILDRQRIPYRIKSIDMGFFTHRIVTDVVNIMRFAMNPADTQLFMRIYFICQTYLRKSQAEQLCRMSECKNVPVLDMAGRLGGFNGMVKGRCAALKTNLKALLDETPSKALFRIEKPMGYGEYLERNGMDANKLFILKILAYREDTVKGFLDRLDYLQKMLKSRPVDRDSSFILSTIHSSKGLEYDRVYLMDVCDGVFPAKAPVHGNSMPEAEIKAFEEERRLFYVGMTRAKNELSIFRLTDSTSCFIREMTLPAGGGRAKAKAVPEAKAYVTDKILTSDFELIIGERVIQKKYGSGTVVDVEYDDKNRVNRFTVGFDRGMEKQFMFPAAFSSGMKLERGGYVSVDEKYVTREVPDRVGVASQAKCKPSAGKKDPRNTYAYWVSKYPEYVVVKREGAFWTCRGESAVTLSELLGYRLGGSEEKPVTGSPNLDGIVEGLRDNAISYIVVEDGDIIDREDY